ncbi:hypothetical protein JCM5350_001735 [Sporobolomyces pararoseus]
MPPIASTSASTPFQLTEPNLRSHTSLEGIAPRRTVQIYLQSIKQAQGYFELPSAPILDSDTSPPSRPSNLNLLEQHESKRRKLDQEEAEERFDGRDTALVMHKSGRVPPQGKESQQGFLKNRAPTVPLKKKPSLVSAMRPRLATVPDQSSSSPLKNESRLKDGKRKSNLENGEKENHRGQDQPERKRSGGKGKATDPAEEEDAVKSFGKGKGKLRSEVENEEEAAELEERLEARKERRRNKVFIRKDHSQSATATGIAAASKLKKLSRRTEDAVRDPDSDGSESGKEKGGKTKKVRKTAEQSGRELIQGLERPIAVGTGRLTLKPSNQLGLFNKGKASARIKVGKAVPDLAFSEMRFLNSTRPAPASDPGSLPSENDVSAQKKASNRFGGKKTYRSETSVRRRSQFEGSSSSSLSDIDYLPPPPPPRPSRKGPQKKESSKRLETTAQTAPPHRQKSSRNTIPPPSRGSSRSSLRLRNMESDPMNVVEAPPPPQEAVDFAAQEESNFSAHSAHSLAMRRRSQSIAQKRTNEEQKIETVVEEQPNDLPLEQQEKTVVETPLVPSADTTLSPMVAASSRISTFHAVDSISSPVVQPSKKRLAPPSSIRTESIDQILRDNASTAKSRIETDSASLLTSSIQCHSVSQATLPAFPLHPPIRTYSHHSRSHSSSAAPSYRSQPSFVTRHRNLSDAAAVDYEGPPLETFNPFAPSNFVVPSQAYSTTSGGGGDSDNALPPVWNEGDQHSGSQNGIEWEEARVGEVAPFEENHHQSVDQFYPSSAAMGRFGRMEETTYETELKEEVIANLWHKNIL